MTFFTEYPMLLENLEMAKTYWEILGNSLNLKKRAISGKNYGVSKLPKALNCAPLLCCSYTCTFNVYFGYRTVTCTYI